MATKTQITDVYSRTFIIVEKIEKEAENGEKYTLYNLYPAGKEPKKSTDKANSLGLKYEPYLYVTDEVLTHITRHKGERYGKIY